MTSAEEYANLVRAVDDIREDMSIRFNAAESNHESAPRVSSSVLSDIRNKMESVAIALRAAAEMREALEGIVNAVDNKELLTEPVAVARRILGGEHE